MPYVYLVCSAAGQSSKGGAVEHLHSMYKVLEMVIHTGDHSTWNARRIRSSKPALAAEEQVGGQFK